MAALPVACKPCTALRMTALPPFPYPNPHPTASPGPILPWMPP